MQSNYLNVNNRLMAKNRVLFISQEIAPYLPASTPFAVQGSSIPQGIIGEGYEVRTFLPKYGNINERRNQLHEVIRLSGLNIVIDDNDHPLIIKVATLQPTRMQVYFIDNDDYFDRPSDGPLETELNPETNDERLIFYARGVLETVKKLRWDPQIIQCMGWISALAPLYLRTFFSDDPTFADTKIVYTLRNDDFSGKLDSRFSEKLRMAGFEDHQLAVLGNDPVDANILARIAIDNSDAIAIVTKDITSDILAYARESGKPILEYPGEENLTKALADFYHTLLGA